MVDLKSIFIKFFFINYTEDNFIYSFILNKFYVCVFIKCQDLWEKGNLLKL